MSEEKKEKNIWKEGGLFINLAGTLVVASTGEIKKDSEFFNGVIIHTTPKSKHEPFGTSNTIHYRKSKFRPLSEEEYTFKLNVKNE